MQRDEKAAALNQREAIEHEFIALKQQHDNLQQQHSAANAAAATAATAAAAAAAEVVVGVEQAMQHQLNHLQEALQVANANAEQHKHHAHALQEELQQQLARTESQLQQLIQESAARAAHGETSAAAQADQATAAQHEKQALQQLLDDALSQQQQMRTEHAVAQQQQLQDVQEKRGQLIATQHKLQVQMCGGGTALSNVLCRQYWWRGKRGGGWGLHICACIHEYVHRTYTNIRDTHRQTCRKLK